MAKVAVEEFKNKKDAIKGLIALLITLVIGGLCGFGIDLAIRPTENGTTIEYKVEKPTLELSEEQVDAKLEFVDGNEEVIEAPTVEEIDGGEIIEAPEDGQGAWHNTLTPKAYYESVGIGNCINNAYGAQCFSLANDFWENYAGHRLDSCGTGAAKGTIADGCWEKNAREDFMMVWDKNELQAGDWVVFTGGEYGHIGMALGGNNNGYVALFGQNQGGSYCEKGGAGTNVINISLKNFIGAFRPKDYIIPEPEPEPEIPENPDTGIVKE